jgi:uncharacterized protein
MSHFETLVQCKKMIGQAEKWLDAGVAHATKKSFDPNTLLAARLAPDQYPLVRQIQTICDSAKFMASRLTGKDAPKHPDTEATVDELKARIKSVVAYLDTFKAADFEGSEKRKIVLPFLEGKHLLGSDYVTEMALPNFYFHCATAYAILRHNGVELGKRDFIGSLSVKD